MVRSRPPPGADEGSDKNCPTVKILRLPYRAPQKFCNRWVGKTLFIYFSSKRESERMAEGLPYRAPQKFCNRWVGKTLFIYFTSKRESERMAEGLPYRAPQKFCNRWVGKTLFFYYSSKRESERMLQGRVRIEKRNVVRML